MPHTLRVLSISPVTHDVHRLRIEKPDQYQFVPGQATDVSLTLPGWEKEKRPFTFTCLNEDPYLEFTIKSYADHDGVTKRIGQLQPGDTLVLEDPWGAIEYKGEGYFIAGGAGITPFIAILRQLQKDGKGKGNTLFFSNKTPKDIIYREELESILGDRAVFIVTDSSETGYTHNRIDRSFLESRVDDFSKQFYVCGPDPMIQSINSILTGKGVDPNAVVFEK